MPPSLLPDLQPAHLRETEQQSETIFHGRLLHVVRDGVQLPDGTPAMREYIRHPGAVMVIPLLDDGQTVVERQYRYPLRQAFIEFPAGKLNAGEDPFLCAQRELYEETGYRAREWARAGVLHPALGYSNEVIEIWFARGLSAGERQLDAGEFLDVLTVTPEILFHAVQTGSVTDGKTLSGLLWLQQVLAGACTLTWQAATESF